MSQAFGSLATACFLLGIVMPSFAADAVNGKDIATRWCASCHVVERGQTSATDQAPPFAYIGKTPDFDPRFPAPHAAPEHAEPVAEPRGNRGLGRLHPVTEMKRQLEAVQDVMEPHRSALLIRNAKP